MPGLTASAFTLANCTPVTGEFPERPDCVRFGSPGDDAAYTVANATPAEFQEIADPPGPVPYAAGLLFDSSESIGGLRSDGRADICHQGVPERRGHR